MSALDHPQVESSLEGFLKKVRPRLKSLFAHYRIPPQDTEDILQQALLALIYHREGIRDSEAWLLGTLRNKCLLYWRERRRKLYDAVDAAVLEAMAEPVEPAQEGADLPSRSDHRPRAAAGALPVVALAAVPPGVRSAGGGGAAGLQPGEHQQGHDAVPRRADAATGHRRGLPEESGMSAPHPTADALEQFVLGRLAPSEMREVARHLLTGCLLCQEVTANLWEPADIFEDPQTLATVELGADGRPGRLRRGPGPGFREDRRHRVPARRAAVAGPQALRGAAAVPGGAPSSAAGQQPALPQPDALRAA